MTAWSRSGYRTRFFFDHNDNLIQIDIENQDSNNQELNGDWITYTFRYDILNNLVLETQEVSENPLEVLISQYRYDRNENLALEITPLSSSGEQLSNIISYVHDERDLLFAETRGGFTDQFKNLNANDDIVESDLIGNSPDISTFSYGYDLNRNLTQFTDSVDNNGDGDPESTFTLYDGFDRPVSVIDAVGNQNFVQYDPSSNIVAEFNFGPTSGLSPTTTNSATFDQPIELASLTQPLLNQVHNKYDELNRLFESSESLFIYNDVIYSRAPVLIDGPLGIANDGLVTTRIEYDKSSRPTFQIEDDLSTLRIEYDGFDRPIRLIDPEFNEILHQYDDNSNLISVAEIERTQRQDVLSGHLPEIQEIFTTIYLYDSLIG